MDDVTNQPRLLIVEDDDLLREVICGFLDEEGFSTAAVSNGRLALALLQEQHFDGVILDLVMPDIDGWQFLHMRALSERLLAVPVLVYTASRRAEFLPNDLRVVMKDAQPRALARAVRQHFGAALRAH